MDARKVPPAMPMAIPAEGSVVRRRELVNTDEVLAAICYRVWTGGKISITS